MGVVTLSEALAEFERNQPNYVYFFFAKSDIADMAAYFKIGMSRDPIARMIELQTGAPHRFFKAGVVEIGERSTARAVEKLLHAEFDDWRLSGEWFRINWSSIADRRTFANRVEDVISDIVPKWKMTELDVDAAFIKEGRKEIRKRNQARRLKAMRSLKNNTFWVKD